MGVFVANLTGNIPATWYNTVTFAQLLLVALAAVYGFWRSQSVNTAIQSRESEVGVARA
jgi:hypothetical protein